MSKLSHLKSLIERIDEKYKTTDEERISKSLNYIKDHFFVISKQNIKDIIHSPKLEKKIWDDLIATEKVCKLLLLSADDKFYVLDYSGAEESQFVVVDGKSISVNNKNGEIVLVNKNCKNNTAIENSSYDLSALLKKADYSDINLLSLLEVKI